MTKYVELYVEDLRTRVRFPPVPPNEKGLDFFQALFIKSESLINYTFYICSSWHLVNRYQRPVMGRIDFFLE